MIILIVLGLSAGAWLFGYRLPQASAVRRLENEIRQRGEPLTLAELAARYPAIPDNDNGAAAILKIWEIRHPGFRRIFQEGGNADPYTERPTDPAVPFAGRKIDRVPRTGTLSTTNREAAEAYLKDRTEQLKALREALQKSQFRFPVEFTNGYNTKLPHLAELKLEVVATFRVQALIATEQGDIDTAIDCLENVARTGAALADEPSLISQLVRVSFHSSALDGMEHLMSQRSLTTSQLDRLDALLERLRMTGALRSAMVGERAFMLSVFDLSLKPKTPPAPGEEEPRSQQGYRGLGILGPFGLKDADRRLILETMGEAIELADDEDAITMRQWNQLFNRASVKANKFPPRIFSAMILPSMSGAMTRFVRLEARRQAAIVAVAVERYRLSHEGRLPEELKLLTPQFLREVPDDPLDLVDPLRLKPLTPGFCVYSVGADGTDDGGKERTLKETLTGFDETFFVER